MSPDPRSFPLLWICHRCVRNALSKPADSMYLYGAYGNNTNGQNRTPDTAGHRFPIASRSGLQQTTLPYSVKWQTISLRLGSRHVINLPLEVSVTRIRHAYLLQKAVMYPTVQADNEMHSRDSHPTHISCSPLWRKLRRRRRGSCMASSGKLQWWTLIIYGQ